MLSTEVNRLLGHALLDPGLLKAIFSPERATALQAFNLRPDERAAILASSARTLRQLSEGLLLTLSPHAQADAPEFDVTTLYQSIKSIDQGAESVSGWHVQSAVQRVMAGLPASKYEHAIPAPQTEEFVRLKTG